MIQLRSLGHSSYASASRKEKGQMSSAAGLESFFARRCESKDNNDIICDDRDISNSSHAGASRI